MSVFKTINLRGFGKKYSGKVRDCYIKEDERILITTDRVSAFDRILGFIPNKGQVLNQLSSFWFQITSDIIENHMIALPDPNVMVAKNCKVIPIEMVVRGYITGVTGTSIWGSYDKGERVIYGIKLEEGLKKNQKLKKPIITPTTKADKGHDERLTRDEIIKRKIVSKKIYEQMEKTSLELFDRGSRICKEKGLLLADTKYEFGILNNKLILIDEIHTSDSSRFWLKKTYRQKFEKKEEPDNYDKEYLRLWFKKQGYSGNGKPPKMLLAFINEVRKRYIDVYEMITGQKFIVGNYPIEKRIKKNLNAYGVV